jgi:hypothetical protein
MNRKKNVLWLLWLAATALGELAGFAVPVVLGLLASYFLKEASGMFGLMIVAGFCEGAVLGFAQSLVLKRYISNVIQRDWIIYTGIAAAVAWTIGMLPGALGDISRINFIVVVIAGLILVPIFLLSIGFAQWLVLRRHVKNAWWWILANTVAWPLGVFISIAVLAIVPDGSPLAVWIIAGLFGGLLMGLEVGAITGIVLARLVEAAS